jgi:glycosyltransferase involved in cell wall biosynthesis
VTCSPGGAGRLRVLFLLPHPPDLVAAHGGARATAEIIKLLSSKHHVSVLYLEPPGSFQMRHPPLPATLLTRLSVGVERPREHTAFGHLVLAMRMLLFDRPSWAKECWSPAAAATVREHVRSFRPNVVHCEFHVMSQYIPTIKEAAPEAVCIVTEHEVGVDAAVEHGSERSGWKHRLGAFARKRSWSRLERAFLAKADAVVTFTEKDRKIVRELIGEARTILACIPLRLAPPQSPPEAGPGQHVSDLLFVGNFMHPPNVDAAMRLVDAIFPRIRETLPNSRLFIVGASPPEELSQAQRPGVIVTGWVESVQPYLAGASIVVAPVRQGGGMRVKVIEALCAGKPVIASALAAEGLDLRSGQEFVLANSDEDFVRHSIELLSSADRRNTLSKGALRWCKRTQGSAAWLREYEELYARARRVARHYESA